MGTQSTLLHVERDKDPIIRPRLFILLLILIVGSTILRSALATRLDGFTYDEAYHITAGVSYLKHADFRLNPEHPPLVKLWVGGLLSATGFSLSPFRELNDKTDESEFAQQDVFLHNDPDSVQRRSRIAMYTLNALLLILLAFASRRTFGPVAALGTMVFLAIDPTVAAHLPVVMTDLPVALLGASAVALAACAFKTWLWTDLAACSAALGLALGTKHSATVFYVFLALAGAALAIFLPRSGQTDSRLRRFGKLAAVLLGAFFSCGVFISSVSGKAPPSAKPLIGLLPTKLRTFTRLFIVLHSVKWLQLMSCRVHTPGVWQTPSGPVLRAVLRHDWLSDDCITSGCRGTSSRA